MSGDAGRELLILGILRRQPMSAYALDQVVRGHAPLYRPLKHGNVYHAVAQLAKRGLLLGKEVKSRRGPHAHKSIFRLSAGGECEFHVLLEQTLNDVQSTDSALEIAYVLLGQLPRTSARCLLEKRSLQIIAQERRLSRLYGDPQRRSGAGYLALAHAVQRIRGERRYLREAMNLLEDPKWYPQWILDDGPVVDR